MSDNLYYSNYCKHCKNILHFITKNNLTDNINFICIDKRVINPEDNNLYVVLENGSKIILPPNVQSVPALLLVKHGYKVILGESIIDYFNPKITQQNDKATSYNGEPQAFSLYDKMNFSSIMSEQYTFFDMTDQDLSTKGIGGKRPLYNYVSANQENSLFIETPPDNYRPDKLSNNVNIESLQNMRNNDVSIPKKLTNGL